MSGEAQGSLVGLGQQHHQANLTMEEDPNDYDEAMASDEAPQWTAGLNEEYESHRQNKTFDFASKEKAMREVREGRAQIVDPRIVFKTKRGAEREILRFKVRLNAAQYAGAYEESEDTFSPVARHESMRLVSAIAAVRGLTAYHLDVKTAFLYPDIGDRVVYMRVPKGMTDAPPNTVLRLRKCIYGLQISGKRFNEKFNGDLVAMGYKRCVSDPCVYVREWSDEQGEHVSYLVLLVDDLQVVTDVKGEYERAREELTRIYKMSDMGKLEFYAGLKVNQSEEGISLSQEAYCLDVLERFNMTDCHPVSNPSSVSAKLSKADEPTTDEERSKMKDVPYRPAIGALRFLSVCTRPDIEPAVNTVSRFCNNPGPRHWTGVKRILRYLKGTHNYGIRYKRGRSEGWELVCYTDADYAGCEDTRRSTTGYVLLYAGAPVCWGAKRQGGVSVSTAEAEYVALSMASNEVKWIRRMLTELGMELSEATPMYGDNAAANLFVTRPTSVKRAKHIDVRYHHVREAHESGVLCVDKVESKENVADLFTKPLCDSDFIRHRDRLVTSL